MNDTYRHVDGFDMRPPHLPYVLLCHESGGRCGFTATVNDMKQWRPLLALRHAHENVCTTKPAGMLILPGGSM